MMLQPSTSLRSTLKNKTLTLHDQCAIEHNLGMLENGSVDGACFMARGLVRGFLDEEINMVNKGRLLSA
jgi:hypothetical protein